MVPPQYQLTNQYSPPTSHHNSQPLCHVCNYDNKNFNAVTQIKTFYLFKCYSKRHFILIQIKIISFSNNLTLTATSATIPFENLTKMK